MTVPGEQHQRPQAQVRPDRGGRHRHQAGADPGRLQRSSPAAGSRPGTAAWSAGFGGDKNPGAKKKAIIAIAHTLLKIAYQVLKTGQPYTDLGPDFYTRRESPEQQHAYLERRLQ